MSRGLLALALAGCGSEHQPSAELPDTTALETNGGTTCGLARDGRARCWGRNTEGQLGRGMAQAVIAAEAAVPTQAQDVLLGIPAVQLSLGAEHLCARTMLGGVRCWGSNRIGQLGYAAVAPGLDGPPVAPDQLGDVPLPSPARQIAAGYDHTCALSMDDSVRCWGNRRGFATGIGVQADPIELEFSGPRQAIRQVAAGLYLTCAVFEAGSVQCRGNTPEVSLKHTAELDLKVKVAELALGSRHACARTVDGNVRCWGSGALGLLGYGHTQSIGDTEAPGDGGDVALGGPAIGLVAGAQHTCALLGTGALRCWGSGENGRLGHGNTLNIGDDETPAAAPEVPVGGRVASVSAGGATTCVLLNDGRGRCWGRNGGSLGTGDFQDRGDDETALAVSPFVVFAGGAP